MRSHGRWICVALAFVGVGFPVGCIDHNHKRLIPPTLPTIAPYVTALAYHSEHPYLAPMPVSPALSAEIEDLLERLEKDAVPILGPIQGEFAPVFCMDPPSDQDIYETLAPIPHGVPFVFEVHRKNVRFSVEKLVDEIDPCRMYPLAGPCQLHHCHFRCTVWWDETYTMGWPVPWTWTDHKQQVLYIDKDHLHRCGEPGNLSGPGGTIESYGGYAPAIGGWGAGGAYGPAGAYGPGMAAPGFCPHGLQPRSCGACNGAGH